jgi:hypothetical protein
LPVASGRKKKEIVMRTLRAPVLGAGARPPGGDRADLAASAADHTRVCRALPWSGLIGAHVGYGWSDLD